MDCSGYSVGIEKQDTKEAKEVGHLALLESFVMN